jgi:ABC-2 type transport system permease protein
MLAKYAAFARIAASQTAANRGELVGRLAFVGVILGVFSALWRAVGEAGMPLPVDRTAMVWYLAATEWIVLSPPPVHVDIEADVRRGDVASRLARPVSYPAALFAEGVGAIAVRAPVIALGAVLCALIYTGRMPVATSLAAVAAFGLAAMLVLHGLHVLTGLTAFWLLDVSPVFWVWQKLLFVLGGLVLPLAIYPEWLTPFPSLLAGPAGFLIGDAAPAALALRLALWTAVTGLAVRLVFARAVRALQVNGG